MKYFSPLNFIGFAFNLWILIKPDTIFVRINKFLDFFYILATGFFFLLPGGRSLLRILLRVK
jgi:hypothetical protein